eukprot:m.176574 g.176574  ORF g.176574 m.176574 type:complete len:812 (-) comp14199_c0_seq1:171-2606(-)
MLAYATATLAVAATATAGPPAPPPTMPTQEFGFHYAFGDNMVLQQAPASAAVYGFMSAGGTSVQVKVMQGTTVVHTLTADVGPNTTQQAFGAGFGVRPCAKADCPPYDMAGWNPWNQPLNTWKALIPPTAATASGAPAEYTIVATCTGCSGNTTDTISNVVFGDMWYCSGQSNMWLPVDHSFSRNDTVAAIQAGKYTNIRGMFGGSANHPDGGTSWVPGGRGYGRSDGDSPWMTAAQAIATGSSAGNGGSYPLFKMGASCWYFGQRLSELGVTVPIGLVDTAIGGQRIEEYMENTTIAVCQNRSSENIPWWDGELYATQVIPFVDMTVKGWVWYQGENNMGALKGSAIENLGYSCEQRQLIYGWRQVWSRTPGTTDPHAPFGIVTLASSGAEGADAAMGAMRIAQTAGYGVLPSPELPNVFLAQAYDLDDPWGPAAGPCFETAANGGYECCTSSGGPIKPPMVPPAPSIPSSPIQCSAPGNWQNSTGITGCKVVDFGANGTVPAESADACCSICSNSTLSKLGCAYWQYYQDRSGPEHATCTLYSTIGTTAAYSKWATFGGIRPFGPPPPPPPAVCTPALASKCAAACGAAADTPVAMGGIHPRSKKPVGDRLGQAAYNLVYGGKGAYTGPTLSGCSLSGATLTINFNASLLAGDKVVLQPWGQGTPGKYGMTGGSYLDVQTNADNFCMEPGHDLTGAVVCPTWAGGTGKPVNTSTTTLDGGWIQGLNFTLNSDGASINVDLSPLNGTAPTSVRYAWSIVNCCDLNDPDLYVTKPCGPASCPIMSTSKLPANPFLAKIVNGKCECIAPQVC